MKTAVKYIYKANPLYVHFRKHYCPKCNKQTELRFKKELVNSKSATAKNYDFSVGDTFFVGNIEFRTPYFYCFECSQEIAVEKMKKYEKLNRK